MSDYTKPISTDHLSVRQFEREAYRAMNSAGLLEVVDSSSLDFRAAMVRGCMADDVPAPLTRWQRLRIWFRANFGWLMFR